MHDDPILNEIFGTMDVKDYDHRVELIDGSEITIKYIFIGITIGEINGDVKFGRYLPGGTALEIAVTENGHVSQSGHCLGWQGERSWGNFPTIWNSHDRSTYLQSAFAKVFNKLMGV